MTSQDTDKISELAPLYLVCWSRLLSDQRCHMIGTVRLPAWHYGYPLPDYPEKALFFNVNFFWLLSILPFFYAVRVWNAWAIRDMDAYVCFGRLSLSSSPSSGFIRQSIVSAAFQAFFHLFFVFVQIPFKHSFTSSSITFGHGAVRNLCSVLSKELLHGFVIFRRYFRVFCQRHFLLLFCVDDSAEKHLFCGSGALLGGILFCQKKSHLICMALSSCWYGSDSLRTKKMNAACGCPNQVFILTLGYLSFPSCPVCRANRISISPREFGERRNFTSNRLNLTAIAVQFFNENKWFGCG
jgi:hypothetical protein